MRNRIRATIEALVVILVTLLSGCATMGPTVEEIRLKMKTSLDAGMNADMTKAEMLEQAGPPAIREPLENGGELWVYTFQKQESINVPDQVVTIKNQTYNLGGGGTKNYEYNLRVNVKFSKNGDMNGWSYKGSLAAFPDNPFTRLTVPQRTTAPTATRPPPVAVQPVTTRPAIKWVVDYPRGISAAFDTFPEGWTTKWEGGAVQDKNGALMADGKGVMRIYDRGGKEQGCYVGVFRAGYPEGKLQVIRKDPAAQAESDLSLGGVPWR